MRILFMGTPDFAVASLKALIEAGHEICGVFTQPDRPKNRGHKMVAPPVKEYALSQNLTVYQPTKLRDGEALALVRELNPDLTVVAAYGRILPEDILENAPVCNGRLSVNQETYGALVVPYCRVLPEKILAILARLQADGLPVIFEDKAPAKTAKGASASKILGKDLTVVSAKNLVSHLRERGFFHVTPRVPCPYLRVYRVDRGNTSVYLLFNEGASPIDTFIDFAGAATPVFYDVWRNAVRKPETEGTSVRVKLAAGNSMVLLCGEGRDALPYRYENPATAPVAAKWQVSLQDAGSDQWRDLGEIKGYPVFNRPDHEEFFCGTIRYAFTLSADGSETVLDLGTVGEIATVTVNGRSCGTLVSAPYTFEIGKAIRAGENEIIVDGKKEMRYWITIEQ